MFNIADMFMGDKVLYRAALHLKIFIFIAIKLTCLNVIEAFRDRYGPNSEGISDDITPCKMERADS